MRILQLLVVCRIIIVVPWQCASPFLWSHNSAVVFGAATVHWIMAPREEVERIIKPILFILRSFQASKYVILCNTLVFAKAAPQIFLPYFEEFFVCSSDSYQTRALKLEILSTIATESSVPIILEEFEVLLCAHGEDLLTFRKILSYIIELSKYDLNYDVQDRACFILKLMSHNLTLSSEEAITSFALQNGGIHHEFAEKIFSGKIHSGIAKSLRIYLPGSLSQIVFHAAPGYEPLPQPRSLHAKNINLCTEFGYETKRPDLKMDKSNSFGTDDPDISSGSLFEESGSVYDFHHYFIKSDGLAELISKSSLESWLDERPGLTSTQMPQQPSGRISINNLNCTVTPKLHMLLDPTNSNGLRADYAFSYEISTVSPVLVLIEIASLDPSQRVKKVIQVRFHHHLLPFKLAVLCNGKKYLTKLWPDIGYFLRPLSMSLNAFIEKERQLPRMFEYSKRCTFRDHMEKIGSEKDESSLHADKIILRSQTLESKAWTSQFLTSSMMHQACAYDSVGKY